MVKPMDTPNGPDIIEISDDNKVNNNGDIYNNVPHVISTTEGEEPVTDDLTAAEVYANDINIINTPLFPSLVYIIYLK